MKINKIRIPKKVCHDVGLQEIVLNKKDLGRIVAIVGKNGSGKSRLLNQIEKYSEYISKSQLADKYLGDLPKNIFNENHYLYESKRLKFGADILNKAKQALARYTIRINNPIQNKKYSVGQISNLVNTKKFDKRVTNKLATIHPESIFEYFRHLCMRYNSLIFENIDTFKKIDSVNNQEANHYFKLKENIEFFLGKELDSRLETANKDNPEAFIGFNERLLTYEMLSPGERILIYYAFILFSYEINNEILINEAIIIIDEPELHLHSSLQQEIIDKLYNLIKDKGQLWIATHSISLLSKLRYDEILLMKNGAITPPSSRTPFKGLEELIGLDESFLSLKDFISSKFNWIYSQFVYQCFLNPEIVANANESDPQALAFLKAISSGSNIKMLDFGAGKGRIGKFINDSDKLSLKIEEYSVLEIERDAIEALEGLNFVNEIYTDYADIPSNNFDVILMCNVLHEIHPKYWEEAFSTINKALKENGKLIILEDKFLPKGENAHEFGFLILAEKELEALLQTNKLEFIIPKEERYKDRILCCCIPKNEIKASQSTIIKALEILQQNSLNNLQLAKKEENGRKYGLFSQLFVNSMLAKEFFEKRKLGTT